MRVIWAPRAIARVWVERLFAKAATLQRQGRRGRKVPELDRDDVRQVRYGKYRIIYRIDPKRVMVLTVRHSRRQWDPGDPGVAVGRGLKPALGMRAL